MRKVLLALLITLLVLSPAVLGCTKQKEEAKNEVKKQTENVKKDVKKAEPPQKKPVKMEFVSSTEKPDACASCHVPTEEKYSLNAESKKIEGHPKVTANSVAECLACHKKEGYPSIQKIAHKHHYKEGSKFVEKYKGSCVHCHKMLPTGEIQVPGVNATTDKAAGTNAAAAKYVAIDVAQVDMAPKGCKDCHKKVSADKDYSLSAELKKIKGHPQLNIDDFNKCYGCHGKTAPNLGYVLHKKHLVSEKYKNYGHSCINCHKPTATGMVLKGKK